MFYMAFDLRYSSSFIYSTRISSGSVHLSMHPSIYYRTVAVLHHAHKHRRTYTRTHPHTYPHCMSCMHTSSTFHVLLPNMHECKLRTQLSITRHEIVWCTDKQRRSHRRVLGGVFDDIWCIIVICKYVNVQDTRERLPHLNIQKHAYHADIFLAGIGVTQQMDASQPSRYLVLLWLQGLRRVVRCKCYRISLAARPGRSWRKASSRDLRIAFYIGSSSPATCVKNMFESTQEATHAKSWNIMKIKWR
jgi:hypothetical protein